MGRNVSIGGETSHIGGETSSVGAKRLTGGRNVLNWNTSSRRQGRNVLKMGAKRLGGRNVYGAKCPGAFRCGAYNYSSLICEDVFLTCIPATLDVEHEWNTKRNNQWCKKVVYIMKLYYRLTFHNMISVISDGLLSVKRISSNWTIKTSVV